MNNTKHSPLKKFFKNLKKTKCLKVKKSKSLEFGCLLVRMNKKGSTGSLESFYN